VSGQAPDPPAAKVTITGFIDSVSSWTKNLGTIDNNLSRAGDTEWFARNRIRPDIIAEIGTTKFVLGVEIDAAWGQVGAQDTSVLSGTGAAAGPQRFGVTGGGFDLNTDLIGAIEIKWAYTEFRLPLVPWVTTVRLGAQPFEAMYKASVYAVSDFAGVHLRSAIRRNLVLHLTYVQVEEASTGVRDGFPRGDDFAVIASVEITPFKGLDIRPVYSLFYADGTTNAHARQPRGGLGVGSVFPAASFQPGFNEHRHTVGLDARWSAGGFYFDPTILYQFGQREVRPSGSVPPPAVGGSPGLSNPFANRTETVTQGREAWLVDLRGGWRSGPLLIEGAAIYTTGNSAGEDIRSGTKTVKYFEPLTTDTTFYAGWAEVWALDIDYTNILFVSAPGLDTGLGIGYDKYGLIRLGSRASYDIRSDLTVRAALTANWTAERVDSSSVLTGALGLIPGDGRGNSRYLGTELDVGLTWSFAPGIVFDLVGGYMWAGNALSSAGVVTGAIAGPSGTSNRNPKDVKTIATRVRLSF
jgi:hypothetical protein